MKLALVGIGKIALDQHIPAIVASTDWELAATVSRGEPVPGVEAFNDFETFLERRPDVGVVSLCLPPVPRFTYAAAAFRAGRHVMLEKPPGASIAECLSLQLLAHEAGVSLFATWHSRQAAKVHAARLWLQNKRLRRLKICWKEDVRRWNPGQSWIWQPGGMGVFDAGVNALSIVTEILAHPIHVTEAVLMFPENREAPISASVRFHHPHADEVLAEFDWRQDGDQLWTIEAETDAGVLLLTEGGAEMFIDGELQSGPRSDGDFLCGEYTRLYARMALLVRSGEIDMDLMPLIHVADAFLLGRRKVIEPFVE